MNPEIQQLKIEIAELRHKLNFFMREGRYQFDRDVKHSEFARLGFFGADPSSQPEAFFDTGNVSGAINSAGGGTWTYNTTTNGGIGSTYYFIPDIVRALKRLGVIPQ